MARSSPPLSVTVFRAVFWAAAIAVPLALVWVVPAANSRLVFNALTVIMYVSGVTAIYKLVLRFAFLAGGSDALEEEVERVEERVELHLSDRDPR